MMEDDQLSEGGGTSDVGSGTRTAKQKFQKVSPLLPTYTTTKASPKRERDRQTHELTGKRGKVRVRVYTA